MSEKLLLGLTSCSRDRCKSGGAGGSTPSAVGVIVSTCGHGDGVH